MARKLGTVSVGAGETIEAVNGSISPEGKFRVVVEHLIQVKIFLNNQYSLDLNYFLQNIVSIKRFFLNIAFSIFPKKKLSHKY